MDGKKRIASRPMSKAEREREIRKMQMAIKYDMFTTFGDPVNLDAEIADLPPEKFKLFTDQFSDGVAFFEAVTLAEQYIRYGNDVSAELWSKILQTRDDYAKFKENKS
ncbi:MAG: hypothetical protein IJ794_00235 [Lachnospiraceae bacterium]|nr:hypothetical protein [Lachnospiraceae bacterium]